MATINAVTLPASGSISYAPTAAAGGGDTLQTVGMLGSGIGLTQNMFYVTNASGSSINVTMAGVNPCSQGSTHNVVTACPANQQTPISIQQQVVNQTNGTVAVTYSAVTSITVELVAIP